MLKVGRKEGDEDANAKSQKRSLERASGASSGWFLLQSRLAAKFVPIQSISTRDITYKWLCGSEAGKLKNITVQNQSVKHRQSLARQLEKDG